MDPEAAPAGGPIVVLTRDSASGRAVANAIAAEPFDAAQGDHAVIVVVERPIPTRTMLRRRVRRLGVVTVAGQVLFLTLVVPWLRHRGRRRMASIVREHGLRVDAFEMPIRRVASVNDATVRSLLEGAQPAVVVVNGTRILSPATLGATRAPFLNLHAGITPAYRGAHGGYWALVDGAPGLVGTTVHLVDPGIDTGAIVDQVTFAVTPADSFATYPTLHLATGLPRLVAAVHAALGGRLRPMADPPDLPSRLRSHPTLWAYLWVRLRRGIR